MAAGRKGALQRFISFLKGVPSRVLQKDADRPHSWIIRFSSSQHQRRFSLDKELGNARLFYWQSRCPLGDEMLRELVQFAVQAYIGRDLVALCDLLFWPEKTIENFYERFEEWKGFCGTEMINFEADLYFAKEQGIQFKTTGGRLEYLDIEINDNTDPQNLLRRIFSEELTIYDGRQLLCETAEIKNFCGFVSTNVQPNYTTNEENRFTENGNSVSSKQTSRILHNVSNIVLDSVSSTCAPTVAHNSIKAPLITGACCRCREENSKANFNNSNTDYKCLTQIACSNEKKAQSTEVSACRCIAKCGQVCWNYLFLDSNEQEMTFPNQGGLQNKQNIQMTSTSVPTPGDNDRNYLHNHKFTSFLPMSADLGSKSELNENVVCANTQAQNIFESPNCSNSSKEGTKLNVCFDDIDDSSLENNSDDGFESCEEGSNERSIEKSATVTSKNSCTDDAISDKKGILDDAEVDTADNSNGYNETVDDNKPNDSLSKADDESCKTLTSGSLVRFVLDRLYGFRAIKRSNKKRKMRAIVSPNENNEVESKEDYREDFKSSKQPRRDDIRT